MPCGEHTEMSVDRLWVLIIGNSVSQLAVVVIPGLSCLLGFPQRISYIQDINSGNYSFS